MTELSVTEIQLPEGPAKSRLHRAEKNETPDDFRTAAERIEAFWELHPSGSILTEVETTVVEAAETLPYLVFTVRAFVRKDSLDERPSATAHATRGENAEDELTAQFPQETAETAAISRAIRNIGILAGPPKAAAPTATLRAPQSDRSIGEDVAAARERDNTAQKALAYAMTQRGFKWSQATVSSIEKGTRALRLNEAQHLAELIGFGAT